MDAHVHNLHLCCLVIYMSYVIATLAQQTAFWVYPNLLTMSELLKTWDQLAKEEALLSKIRFCWHAHQGLCNPPTGRRCNFAQFLRDLSVPEENYGDWSKVWQQGEVDVSFWESYHPNKKSQQRLSWQFFYGQ